MEKEWMSFKEAEEKFGVKFIIKREPRTIDKIIAKVLRFVAMIFVAGFVTKGIMEYGFGDMGWQQFVLFLVIGFVGYFFFDGIADHVVDK